MKFNPLEPYNDLPLLPPREDIESKKILRKTTCAARALAELKGLGETVPNQAILVNSIILQEAKSSSEIENVITTNDELYQALSAQSKQFDSSTKEVLSYREALWKGFNELKDRQILSTNLFITIVQILKNNQAGIRNNPGTALRNNAGQTIYTPPAGEQVIRDKLRNLEEYIHTEHETDPLIKMAVIHYQFEAIHPFGDGNGRTGRIINILYLVQQELLDLPVLYLSKYIIDNKPTYYRLLRSITENNEWEPWILYMLEALENTAIYTRNKILEIRSLMLETIEISREKLPEKVYSKELIEILFRQPYTKAKFLVDDGIAKRQTAAEYLKELEHIGVLKSKKIGREVLYLNLKLYDLLKQ